MNRTKEKRENVPHFHPSHGTHPAASYMNASAYEHLLCLLLVSSV